MVEHQHAWQQGPGRVREWAPWLPALLVRSKALEAVRNIAWTASHSSWLRVPVEVLGVETEAHQEGPPQVQ